MNKFSKEEKIQMVDRYHNGESAEMICKQCGVSKSTFYTWLKPCLQNISKAKYTANFIDF